MTFRRYDNLEAFRTDVLDILLEDEVINNLPISIVSGISTRAGAFNFADWLLSVVTDERGDIVLVAICTKPYSLLLYEPKGKSHDGSIEFLASELKRIGFVPPSVFAPHALSKKFADIYDAKSGRSKKNADKPDKTLILMRLDKLAEYEEASGFCRVLTEDDLTFVPFWEQAFCIDCLLPPFPLEENKERIKTRIGKNSHFIWEDGLPVAQAVFGRETPNGAVISWVYTPPLYRGQRYATSVVAEVVKSVLKQGKSYCCLFADAANPASCAVYRKLGFYDVSVFEEIHFS